MTEFTNECCRDFAEYCNKTGQHFQAMRWYNTARARTIGHIKSASYDFLAKEQAKLAGVEFSPFDYAKDEEAINFTLK